MSDDKSILKQQSNLPVISSYEHFRCIVVELNKIHEEVIALAEKQLKTLQKSCKHSNTKYHPDASGNNDSWYECTFCGKIDP